MIAIGIGAHSAVTDTDILAAVVSIASSVDLDANTLATFDTAPFAGAVKSIAEGAGYAFIAMPIASLEARASECQTRSQRSLDATGVPSIAEAAALAAAGPGSRLIVARLICGKVTAAAAQSADHAERGP